MVKNLKATNINLIKFGQKLGTKKEKPIISQKIISVLYPQMKTDIIDFR